jgi:hypothetical protein
MIMQFGHKKDYEIRYNFGIHYNHNKHYLHHENNCTNNTTCSPNSSGTIINRKLIETLEKHNWSSRPPRNMTHNFLKSL